MCISNRHLEGIASIVRNSVTCALWSVDLNYKNLKMKYEVITWNEISLKEVCTEGQINYGAKVGLKD